MELVAESILEVVLLVDRERFFMGVVAAQGGLSLVLETFFLASSTAVTRETLVLVLVW